MAASTQPGGSVAGGNERPRDRLGSIATLRTAMRREGMRRALLAFGIFRVSEMATWVALLVWAFDHGGATATGVIAVAQMAPAAIAAPLGSALTERMPRPTALRLGYLLQAATNLATAVALFLDAPFWSVAVLAGLAASAMTLSRPVHHALVPELAHSPEELTAGNAASTAVEGTADFVGPAVASGLLILASAGWVFVVMGLAGLLCAWLATGVRVVHVAHHEGDGSYWRGARAGLEAALADRGAAALTAVVTGQFVVLGLLDVLTIVLALDVLGTGPGGPGLISSGLGIGALVGAAASVALVGRRRLGPAMAAGMLVVAASLAGAAAAPGLLAAMALFALVGAGNALIDVASRTLLQRCIAPRLLARILGVQEALMMAGTALGAAIAPVLVLAAGPRGAFLAAALALPALGVACWAWLRRLDTRPPTGESVRLLRSVPLCSVLPVPQLEQLASALEEHRRLVDGEVLIEQGDVGDRCYVIVDGTLVVERDGTPIAVLGAGDLVGEIALLRDVPRTATVRATSDVHVVTLHREPFLLAVTGSEAAHRAIDDVVGRRLTAQHRPVDPTEPGGG